jgi:DNA-binding GntR family transcriptional regulator
MTTDPESTHPAPDDPLAYRRPATPVIQSIGSTSETEGSNVVPLGADDMPIETSTAVNRRTLLLASIRNRSEGGLAQEIFDELAIAIVEGKMQPGDTINSVGLARRFGTSRTPIREAIVELERQGVVVVPPRRRPYIATPTPKQVREIYDLRASLYVLVSELIVQHATPADLAALKRWQDALEIDVAQGSVDDYFWHNVGFRNLEARISKNAELENMICGMGLRTLQFRHFSLSTPARIAQSVEDHRRLMRAYEERDAGLAASLNRALIRAGFLAIERSGLLASG